MPSPNAERRFLRPIRASVPTSFQSRLTYAFVGVVALTLALVSPVVINRFDDYFREQEAQNLFVRRITTAAFISTLVDNFTKRQIPVLIRDAGGGYSVNPAVAEVLEQSILPFVANSVAQADLRIDVGSLGPGVDGRPDAVIPATDGHFFVANTEQPANGLARDPAIEIGPHDFPVQGGSTLPDWGLRVELT